MFNLQKKKKQKLIDLITKKKHSPQLLIQEEMPKNPNNGDLWFESSTGHTYIYYNNKWVKID